MHGGPTGQGANLGSGFVSPSSLGSQLVRGRAERPVALRQTDHPGGFYAPLTEGIRLCNFKAAPSLPAALPPFPSLPSGYMEYLTCPVAHVAFELEKIRSSYPPIPSSPTQTDRRCSRRKGFLAELVSSFRQGGVVKSQVVSKCNIYLSTLTFIWKRSNKL